MANLYNNGIDQAIDGNGNVYPGAKRYFYDNGTTTLRTIWQDEAKTSTHANPVVADSNGVFPQIWIEGVYSTRLEDTSGSLIPQSGATQDDVNSIITSILTTLASTGTELSNIDYDEASSSGLDFAYSAGRIDNKDGTVTSVSASSLTLPASSTSYIYLDLETDSVVQSTTSGRAVSKLLYTVTTDGSSITAVVNEKEAFERHDQYPSDYLSGLAVTINSTDSDHDVDIATGYARSADDTLDGALSTAITKRIDSGTDANWKEGTDEGGLADGLSLSATTTYYIHLLIAPDGSCDAGFDTSATAVNLIADSDVVAAGYTKYRLIGQFDTDGSSNIDSTTFLQVGGTGEKIALGSSTQKIQTSAYDTGSVDQAAIGAGAVHQAELDYSFEDDSTTSTSVQQFSLSGGFFTLGFGVRVGSTFNNEGGAARGWNVNLGTAGTPSNTITTGYVSYMAIRAEAAQTTYTRSYYINSSPPYDLGNGEVPMFVFAEVSPSGEVVNLKVTETPPWIYNGPTDVTGKPVRVGDSIVYGRYESVAALNAKRDRVSLVDLISRGQISNTDLEERVFVEIKPLDKNADMGLIPHPFLTADPANTVIMLDPMSPLLPAIVTLHRSGENVSEIVRGDYLVIDNSDNGRACSPGVMPVNFRWKNTGGA